MHAIPAIRLRKHSLKAGFEGAGMVEYETRTGRSAAAVPTRLNTREVRYTTETNTFRQASKCAAQGPRFSLPAKGRKTQSGQR